MVEMHFRGVMNIRSNFLRVHFLGDNVLYSGSENGDMYDLEGNYKIDAFGIFELNKCEQSSRHLVDVVILWIVCTVKKTECSLLGTPMEML